MNIYSPGQIDYILEQTLGKTAERRMAFIRSVGKEVAAAAKTNALSSSPATT